MLFFLVCIALIFTLKMKMYYQTKTFTDDGLTGANLASATIDIHNELGYKSDVNNFDYENMYRTYVKCLGYNLEATPTSELSTILKPTTTRHYVSDIHILKFYIYNKTKDGNVVLAKVVDSENITKGSTGTYYGSSRISNLSVSNAITPDGTQISNRPTTLMIYSQISFDLPSVFGKDTFIGSILKPMYITKQHTVDVVETHDYKVVETELPTCLDNGYEKLECQDEGCTEKYTRTLYPLGHDMQTSIKENEITCLIGGYRISKCSRCDYEERIYIDALGHDMGEWNTIQEPTYENDGLAERKCNRCDYKETRTLPALNKIPDNKIRIVLASRETDLDLTNFKSDLMAKLNARGINPEIVTIQTTVSKATDSKDVNFADAVSSWKIIGMDTWHATNDGYIYTDTTAGSSIYSWNDSAELAHQKTYPGWYGTGLFNDKEKDLKNMKIDFNLVKGGQLLGGPAFNVKLEDDGSVSGYFFNVSMHVGLTKNIYQLRLWRFEHYALNDLFSRGINQEIWCFQEAHAASNINGYEASSCDVWNVGKSVTKTKSGIHRNITSTATCLASWTLNASDATNVKYHIEYNSQTGQIMIYMNNQLVVNVYDKTYPSGTYGFWGNNCEQKESMYLSDFKVEGEKYLGYNEILKQTDWNTESVENIIVNIDNSLDSAFTDQTSYAEALSKSLSYDIHLVQWGTNTNKDIISEYIKDNLRGTFIDNSNYNNALEKTADYIQQIHNQK